MINILTINVALLTFTLFGIPIYSIDGNASERYRELVQFLSEGTHDVITLQEISPHWSKKLIKALKETYPYFATYTTHKFFPKEMLILSKNPLIDCVFEPFEVETKLERIALEKGILSCTVESKDGEYTVVTTHLVALGLSESPTSEYVETIRGKQIEQLIAYVDKILVSNPDRITFITGDFNAGPEASKGNYDLLLEHFTDIFVWDEKTHGENKLKYTWLPGFDSSIASKKAFRESPPQRIDMILIPKQQAHLLNKNDNVNIVPTIFSDHSAVESTLVVE